MSRHVLVAGLGHVLMGDDAIGPYCVRHLAARYEFPPDVAVVDLGAPGLDLALHLSTADYVLAIDAVRGLAPGAIAVYDDSRLANLSRKRAGIRLETHSPALEEALLIARLIAGRPLEMRLVGLAGACFDFGAGMTPAIRARMPLLIAHALDQLARWDVQATSRALAEPADTWWECGEHAGTEND